MEMPPFRRPRLGRILLRSLVDKTLLIAGRAITVAAPAGAVLWVLSNTPLLGALANILDPIGKFLGLNGVILLAFCFSLPANELLIPVILMTLTQTGSLQDIAGIEPGAMMGEMLTLELGICMMVFTLFHWPCATTLMTIYRQTGSKKKTAAAFFVPTAAGCILCLALNLLL